MKYKIIVYGLGAEFTKLYNSLKYLEVTQQIEIVALTAKNIPNLCLDKYFALKKRNI